MSIIKWVIMRNNDCYNSEVPSDGECDYDLPVNQLSLSSDQTKVDSPDLQSSEVSKSISGKPLDQKSGQNKDGKSPRKELDNTEEVEEKKPRKALRLPMSLLDSALQQCEQFLRFKQNEDLEEINEQEMLNIDWDMFLQQYYSLCHNKGVIPGTRRRLSECERMANQLRRYFPQFDLDGVKNLWIVKPGAKSRGRGIFCSDKLHDMLKLVDSVVRKDSKFVVQKYIERPLIIFETKFDIRQWFLVTDWNPLTIWWYKDFYLRFCKKNFTLEELDEVIHLSNNSIQKNYTVDPTRSKEIPADSMWASDDEFLDFLQKRGHGTAIDEIIRPGMQKSVICALLTTRDIVEYRKSSFELYGADFMLTEDYKPWLLEINSSPTLAPSTHVTKRLCDCVVEDTMKVVIDRKQDKNCDTGRFELIYKAVPVTIPQYLGINLSVEGNSLNTPTVHISKPRKINVPESLYQTPKIDLTSSVNLISKKEKKKQSLKLIHKDKESSPEAKETVNTENSEKSKVTEKSEKPLSEPGSAKYEREGLLFKRKRHSTRSVEVPKSQLDLMKPTDSYLKKIREGVKDSQKVLTEEAGASNRSFCPKCGSNGIIKLHHNEACICQQDSIQNTISSDVITQFRNPTGFFTRAGIVNHTSRSKVLKVLNRDPASQLILPLAPRRLIINPPDILPISATTSAATNLSKFLNSSSGLNFNSVTDTFPYRKAKKQKSKFQKSFPEQTMFVLAESYTQKL